MCCCLHGTEPAPKANSIIRNRTVASDRLRSLHDADQQTSQMLGPGRFPELIRDRRDNAAAVANATTALTNGLSATNQRFVSYYFLKRLKAEISQNAKSPWDIERSSGDPCDAKLFLANKLRPEIRRDKDNQRTEHCATNSDARSVKLLIGQDWHALQTQFPTSGIELRRCDQLGLRSFHSASITAAGANPSEPK